MVAPRRQIESKTICVKHRYTLALHASFQHAALVTLCESLSGDLSVTSTRQRISH